MESKNLQIFFALLRYALWHKEENLDKDLSLETVLRLFSIAEQQAVSGLIIDAVLRNNIEMPPKKKLKAVGVLVQIKRQGIAVNKGVTDLHQLLSSSNIDYDVVKGQTVASYYPEPLLRQSGDIDYYCSKEYFPKSQEVISRVWKVNTETGKAEKHCHFDYNDIMYEGHFQLLSLYDRKRRSYWQHLIDNDGGGTAVIDGVEVKTLSPTVHTLYIFMHLYNHLMKLGVGLRQFCDMGVMLRNAKKLIEMEALRTHLHALGMEKAYRACGSILVDKLGLSEDELGYTLSDNDRRYGKKILDVVLYRGNMGNYEGSSMRSEGRREWKMKAIGIKLSHFIKFVHLSPGHTCGWMLHEIRRTF